MIEQFNLKLEEPKVYFEKEGGPKNHKYSYQIGEKTFNYVGEWRFEPNLSFNSNYPLRIASLSESLLTLLPKEELCLKESREDGLCQTNQYRTVFFPNVVCRLGDAILNGDIARVIQFGDAGDRNTFDLFRKTFMLTNLYHFQQVESSNSIRNEFQFCDHSLVSGEELLMLRVSPLILAVLTKQSSLAAELYQRAPINPDTPIEGFNLSLKHIAEKLKLKTFSETLNPLPVEDLPSKLSRLTIVSSLKLK